MVSLYSLTSSLSACGYLHERTLTRSVATKPPIWEINMSKLETKKKKYLELMK